MPVLIDRPSKLRDWLMKKLYIAYLEAREHKRDTLDEHRFEMNLSAEIASLADEIMDGTYHPSRGIVFVVKSPVQREIFAANFRDRVVQHFLYDMVAPWWERHLHEDAYSCRKDKGTLYGIKRLQHHIRVVSENGRKKVWVYQGDIQGFFMNLDHQLLYERVVWGLDRQFVPGSRGRIYHILKYLWHAVIFDDPTTDVAIRGLLKDWDGLPIDKSLIFQPKWRGIVIGNLTSQLLSNIFLDMLDRYIAFELGYRHYGRYVDDFYIVVPEEQKRLLEKDIPSIRNFMEQELKVKLHPKKSKFQPAERGVKFVGAKVYPRSITAGPRLKKNAVAAFRAVAEGRADPDKVVSYLGLMKHFNCDKFLQQTFESLGWDYRPIDYRNPEAKMKYFDLDAKKIQRGQKKKARQAKNRAVRQRKN